MVMPQMLPPQQRMLVGICGETCDREADHHQNEDVLPRGGAALTLEKIPLIARIERVITPRVSVMVPSSF
jgi:hypothetical protein